MDATRASIGESELDSENALLGYVQAYLCMCTYIDMYIYMCICTCVIFKEFLLLF